MKEYESNTSVPLQDEKEQDEVADASRRCKTKLEEDVWKEEYPEQDEKEKDDHIWDGSESEFIADDDALIYEEQQTGIKLDYQLNFNEILFCLRRFSGLRRENKKVLIETILLALAGAGSFVAYGMNFVVANLILGIACLLLIGLIWIVPQQFLRNYAKTLSKEKKPIYVEVYPDEIVVGNEGKERKIELDGSCKYQEMDHMYLLFPPDGEILVIPMRVIEPDFLPDVQAMLVAGTIPKDKDSENSYTFYDTNCKN